MQEKEKIVISLTSYPARINYVGKTIETLLDQSLKADVVILWLAKEQFPNLENDLPNDLVNLKEKGLIIDWCEDIKSYKKLIPSLIKYPNDIIVTADDDVLYEKDWLEKLYNSYLQHPNMINTHRAHRILFKDDKILPYKEWIFCINGVEPSFNNFATGSGGILYPPNCFYKDILNKELFLKLCPIADDVWFWAMTVLNNTKINVITDNYGYPDSIDGSQSESLNSLNVDQNKNDEQLKNIFEHYPELIEKLDKSYFKNPNATTFLEKIFSVKKEGRKQITRILGVKITKKLPKEIKDNNENKNDKIYLDKEFDKVWKRIENKENIALLRYGDGEWRIMTGQAMKAIEGWVSPEHITKLGEDLLKTLDIDSDNFIYGITCSCCDPDISYWYSQHIKSKNRTFATVFVNWNYQKFIKKFDELKRDAIFIGNINAKDSKIGNLNILKYYFVTNNCMDFWENKAQKMIEEIKKDYGDRNDLFYVVCAGPMSEPIIYELYKNNPNNCYIDFGSALDKYIHKYRTRSYENPKSKNAQKNCIMENPRTSSYDISVVLLLNNASSNIQQQLTALKNQTLKPREVLIYQNEAGNNLKISDEIKSDLNITEIHNENKNIFENIRARLEKSESEYVCFIEGNIVPGRSWLENCYFNMTQKAAMYGTIGTILNKPKNNSFSKFIQLGFNNETRYPKEVDFVQGNCFIKKEWLLKITDFTPFEDISNLGIKLSLLLRRNLGIKTFVPPHPTRHHNKWGLLPEYKKELNKDETDVLFGNKYSDKLIKELYKGTFLYQANKSYVNKMFKGSRYVKIMTLLIPVKKTRHYLRGKLNEIFYK